MAPPPSATDAASQGGRPAPGSVAADLDNGRMLSLSDSVFAFAMTLMVLSFDTPDPQRVSNAALRAFILHQWPSLIAYVITFSVVANYWAVHHRTFRYIRSHDMVLVWINIAFLFCISLLP